MTPSDRAKALGCKTLTQVVTTTKQSKTTLINWFESRPIVFDACCIYTAQQLKKDANK